MKRIVLLLSCVLLSTQLLVAEHTCRLGTAYSWAECDTCRQERYATSAKASFDPEFDNWCEGGRGCNDDDSELVNPV